MTSLLVRGGVHVPACPSLRDHIDAAVRETAGSHYDLLEFVDGVRADWAEEQQIADEGDPAVIRHWAAVDADFLLATFA